MFVMLHFYHFSHWRLCFSYKNVMLIWGFSEVPIYSLFDAVCKWAINGKRVRTVLVNFEVDASYPAWVSGNRWPCDTCTQTVPSRIVSALPSFMLQFVGIPNIKYKKYFLFGQLINALSVHVKISMYKYVINLPRGRQFDSY